MNLTAILTIRITNKVVADKLRIFFAEKERVYKLMSTGKPIPK